MFIDFLKRLYLSLFGNSASQPKPILVSKERKHKKTFSDEDSKRSNRCNYE